MILSQLNEVSERVEENKQFLRRLLRTKIFNDQEGLDSVIQNAMKKLGENKTYLEELQKQLDLKQRKGKNHYQYFTAFIDIYIYTLFTILLRVGFSLLWDRTFTFSV